MRFTAKQSATFGSDKTVGTASFDLSQLKVDGGEKAFTLPLEHKRAGVGHLEIKMELATNKSPSSSPSLSRQGSGFQSDLKKTT